MRGFGVRARFKATSPIADGKVMVQGGDARRLRVGRLLPLVGLVLIALAFSWSHWAATPRWTLDSLFYEAQSLELTGTPAATARQQVFFGPLGKASADTSGRLDNRAWVDYVTPLYRRRWVVPGMAAALRPVFGTRALELVSLLGYVLSGLLAYALARRRFSTAASFAAGAFVLWFPPLRMWAGYPLTDSMGVAAMALAFAAGAWALSGRSSRLLLWAGSVLLLAFTRDTAIVAVAGAVWLAIATRSRRAVALALTGIAAAAPAPLLFGAQLRLIMAYVFSNDRIPADASWHYVLHEYGTFTRLMIKSDFPFRSSLAVTALLLAVVALLALRPSAPSLVYRFRQPALLVLLSFLGVVALFVAPLQLASWPDPLPFGILLVAALLPLFLPAGGDEFITLLRGGAVGAIGYLLLLPQPSDLRLPLVMLPFAAMGVARAFTLVPGRGPLPETPEVVPGAVAGHHLAYVSRRS